MESLIPRSLILCLIFGLSNASFIHYLLGGFSPYVNRDVIELNDYIDCNEGKVFFHEPLGASQYHACIYDIYAYKQVYSDTWNTTQVIQGDRPKKMYTQKIADCALPPLSRNIVVFKNEMNKNIYIINNTNTNYVRELKQFLTNCPPVSMEDRSGYEQEDDSRIYRLPPRPNNNNYLRIRLNGNGKYATRIVQKRAGYPSYVLYKAPGNHIFKPHQVHQTYTNQIRRGYDLAPSSSYHAKYQSPPPTQERPHPPMSGYNGRPTSVYTHGYNPQQGYKPKDSPQHHPPMWHENDHVYIVSKRPKTIIYIDDDHHDCSLSSPGYITDDYNYGPSPSTTYTTAKKPAPYGHNEYITHPSNEYKPSPVTGGLKHNYAGQQSNHASYVKQDKPSAPDARNVYSQASAPANNYARPNTMATNSYKPQDSYRPSVVQHQNIPTYSVNQKVPTYTSNQKAPTYTSNQKAPSYTSNQAPQSYSMGGQAQSMGAYKYGNTVKTAGNSYNQMYGNAYPKSNSQPKDSQYGAASTPNRSYADGRSPYRNDVNGGAPKNVNQYQPPQPSPSVGAMVAPKAPNNGYTIPSAEMKNHYKNPSVGGEGYDNNEDDYGTSGPAAASGSVGGYTGGQVSQPPKPVAHASAAGGSEGYHSIQTSYPGYNPDDYRNDGENEKEVLLKLLHKLPPSVITKMAPYLLEKFKKTNQEAELTAMLMKLISEGAAKAKTAAVVRKNNELASNLKGILQNGKNEELMSKLKKMTVQIKSQNEAGAHHQPPRDYGTSYNSPQVHHVSHKPDPLLEVNKELLLQLIDVQDEVKGFLMSIKKTLESQRPIHVHHAPYPPHPSQGYQRPSMNGDRPNTYNNNYHQTNPYHNGNYAPNPGSSGAGNYAPDTTAAGSPANPAATYQSPVQTNAQAHHDTQPIPQASQSTNTPTTVPVNSHHSNVYAFAADNPEQVVPNSPVTVELESTKEYSEGKRPDATTSYGGKPHSVNYAAPPASTELANSPHGSYKTPDMAPHTQAGHGESARQMGPDPAEQQSVHMGPVQPQHVQQANMGPVQPPHVQQANMGPGQQQPGQQQPGQQQPGQQQPGQQQPGQQQPGQQQPGQQQPGQQQPGQQQPSQQQPGQQQPGQQQSGQQQPGQQQPGQQQPGRQQPGQQQPGQQQPGQQQPDKQQPAQQQPGQQQPGQQQPGQQQPGQQQPVQQQPGQQQQQGQQLGQPQQVEPRQVPPQPIQPNHEPPVDHRPAEGTQVPQPEVGAPEGDQPVANGETVRAIGDADETDPKKTDVNTPKQSSDGSPTLPEDAPNPTQTDGDAQDGNSEVPSNENTDGAETPLVTMPPAEHEGASGNAPAQP